MSNDKVLIKQSRVWVNDKEILHLERAFLEIRPGELPRLCLVLSGPDIHLEGYMEVVRK